MLLTGINHLAFITEDLEKTIRFYRDLLGMKLVAGIGHDGYRHYFLNCGNTLVAFFEYEGADPLPASLPVVTNPTPVGRMTAWPGNAYPLRDALLANRQARVTGDYEAIPEPQRRAVARPEKVMPEAAE